MKTLSTAVLVGCLAVTAFAQEKPTDALATVSTPLPLTLSMQPDLAAPASEAHGQNMGVLYVEVGQTRAEVYKLMGASSCDWPSCSSHRERNTLIEEWRGSDNTLWIRFKDHAAHGSSETDYRVATVKRYVDHHTAAANGPSKSEEVAGKVANTVNSIYLTWACPKIYRVPLFWMTAEQYQLLVQCNANGFMLFGLYLYTGN
jgi:S-formylglutathione hydrolase FrmB